MSDCLFCQIVAGQVPAKVAAESDNSLAFYDIAPQAPVHVLVVPKRHFDGVNDVTPKFPEVFDDLMFLAQEVTRLEGIRESGYRLVFNSGEDGQQTVNHLHVHVLGGRRMAWPPG
ncbi:MAG: histidine triad nucleotide-binding protein [Acidimicrobiales bacterium]|jgi:histidine triad (HIT) family protein